MLMDFNIPIWLWWLQSGFSLGIAIYHLMLFFVTRERVYCSFALMLFSWLIFFAAKQGLLRQVWPDSPDVSNSIIHIFLGLSIIGCGYFTKDFLNLTVDFGRYYPKIYKVPMFSSAYHWPTFTFLPRCLSQ